MMSNIKVDPKIQIRVVPDGEVHVVFNWSLSDLEQFARAFVAMSNGKIKEGDVSALFRLRNIEGIDYFISELQNAKAKLLSQHR